MVKLTRGPAASGPSSSLGIVRFFDADTSGPKLTPEFVVIVALALMLAVLAIKAIAPI